MSEEQSGEAEGTGTSPIVPESAATDKADCSFCPKCETLRFSTGPSCTGCGLPIPPQFQNLTFDQCLYNQSVVMDKWIFALDGVNAVTRNHVHERALLFVQLSRKRITQDQFSSAYFELSRKYKAAMAEKSRGCAPGLLLLVATIWGTVYGVSQALF